MAVTPQCLVKFSQNFPEFAVGSDTLRDKDDSEHEMKCLSDVTFSLIDL